MKGPLSPCPQNPRASNHDIVNQLNPSYNSATSTSPGRSSVRDHMCSAEVRAGIVVKSCHCSQDGRPRKAVPTASTCATGWSTSAACSATDTTSAVEPSTGTSQSYRRNGEDTILEPR